MTANKQTGSRIYPLDPWNIIETAFDAQNSARNETVFSLGNGLLGMRGTFEEGCPAGTEGYEGTYINGFYESETIRYPETAYGYAENSQTMLNVVNSKIIRLSVDGEEFSMDTGEVLSYRRSLSLKQGMLTRSLVWQSPDGKQINIEIERLVSFQNKYLAAIRYAVTPINFSGNIRLVSLLDGDVCNLQAEEDPRVGSGLNGRVLQLTSKASEGQHCHLTQSTQHSGLSLACCAEHRISSGSTPRNICETLAVGCEYEVSTAAGETVFLDKFIAYTTSRYFPDDLLLQEAESIASAACAAGFESIRSGQAKTLQDFWHHADIEIKGDAAIQQGIRLNMFHLLQAAGQDGITNICAKGLTGEGYEGHYFWDTETYMLPFFLFTKPEVSRSLLEYRYSILDNARKRAREMAHSSGALFPWRTIGGDECSAYYPAGTAQYHINADIAYAIKKYMDATADYDFLLHQGAEMLFETARLWANLGFYNPRRGNQFCIHCVTGPDEYNVLVNNNCYTNLMAKENLQYAYDTAVWMRDTAPDRYTKITSIIGLRHDEILGWKHAAEHMYVPYDAQEEIYLQDDAFLDRQPMDVSKAAYPMLMHYHPLVIYRHKVCKQADLVLALYLLSDRFTQEEKKRNFDYYEKVTTHDSSLSSAIFSVVASEIGDHSKAYDLFMKTARTDLDDLHHNTKDGIHAANMAGSWMCLVNGFAGMRAYEGMLHFAPYLPDGWDEYSFQVRYQGRLIKVTVSKQGTRYRLLKGARIKIMHREQAVVLQTVALQAVIFDLDGVIVSTDRYHYMAWKKLADEEGILFDRTINQRLLGVSRMDSLNILLERAGKPYTAEEKQALAERKNEDYRSFIQGLSPADVLPGVKAFLKSVREAGLKTAVASSSKNAEAILTRIGMSGDFDIITSGNHIQRSKPDPEVNTITAQRLEVDPDACLVIEDAQAGIDAAISAGMLAMGVGAASDYAPAALKRDSLDQFTLANLLESLQALSYAFISAE